jgi:hypothetical protein
MNMCVYVYRRIPINLDLQQNLDLPATISMSEMDFLITAMMYLSELALFHMSTPLQDLPPRPLCICGSLEYNNAFRVAPGH